MFENLHRTRITGIVLATSLALAGCGVSEHPSHSVVEIPQAPSVPGQIFRIPQIADTQFMVAYKSPDYIKTLGWVADNIDTQNFKFVIHNGDITNQSSRRQKNLRDQEYVTASTGMAQLDGKICYSISIGNHDLDAWPTSTDGEAAITKDRSAERFNQYFSIERFKKQGCLQNSYPAGTSDNYYQEFNAGGTDYGVLTLKYNPTPDEIAWANDVVTTHADRHIIINTHSYLYKTNALTPGGHTVWDGLAKQHKNIQLILSGHTGPTAHDIRYGNDGNPVYEIMMDYQNTDNEALNTYIRLLSFDPAAHTISASTFSPILGTYMTDPANDFTFTDVAFGPIK